MCQIVVSQHHSPNIIGEDNVYQGSKIIALW